jgi:DNA-binding transcriptional LysR family regulator
LEKCNFIPTEFEVKYHFLTFIATENGRICPMQLTDDIATFVRTVDLGTFAAVGEDAGLSASAVARIVSRLEGRLGVKLLARSTRRLTLTQEGETYLQHARAIVSAVEVAAAEVGISSRPRGLVRVNTGSAFARHRLVHWLPVFQAQYPDITLDLRVSDQRGDPDLEQTDITIRVGPLADSNLVLIPLGTVKRVIAASPAYLARRAAPQQPRDLLAHNCLLLSGFAHLARWPMWEGGQRILLNVKGSITCDSADVLLDMALAGLGIARFGDFLAEAALADGRLVPLLGACHDSDPQPLSALVLPGRQHIPRVRVLIDFLKLACASKL